MADEVRFEGLTPYVSYEDAGAALDWLSRVFGFEERARYVDKDGVVQQAEMRVGDTELWVSGIRPGDDASRFEGTWIGVWVDDVDAMYERIRAAGIDLAEPVDKDYDVRTIDVKDPGGYSWGFMKRLGTGYVQKIPTEEGGLEEILPDASDRVAPG
jgi:uncharacterized glyoxalase superfamily protein PhnB